MDSKSPDINQSPPSLGEPEVYRSEISSSGSLESSNSDLELEEISLDHETRDHSAHELDSDIKDQKVPNIKDQEVLDSSDIDRLVDEKIIPVSGSILDQDEKILSISPPAEQGSTEKSVNEVDLSTTKKMTKEPDDESALVPISQLTKPKTQLEYPKRVTQNIKWQGPLIGGQLDQAIKNYGIKFFDPQAFIDTYQKGEVGPEEISNALTIGHPQILTFLYQQDQISCQDFLDIAIKSENYDYEPYLLKTGFNFEIEALDHDYSRQLINLILSHQSKELQSQLLSQISPEKIEAIRRQS